jgi:hypothetical protein
MRQARFDEATMVMRLDPQFSLVIFPYRHTFATHDAFDYCDRKNNAYTVR